LVKRVNDAGPAILACKIFLSPTASASKNYARKKGQTVADGM
jgi:hypothetical protein